MKDDFEAELFEAMQHTQNAHRIASDRGDREQAERLFVAYGGLSRALSAEQRKRLNLPEVL